eukprot:CAMPEP_0173449724 /NCGR_PEP_ID=MMETSP1357-20121228/43281_1 /TAXON_ID=77926 /ORGANISM="Hemiselmis rufescens, Strain PCC563" /LENGTH=52 /DNA_ID=CAMNT_0014416337 /DNA_START=133 /DNA_END=287 /DNA_ORIENTATION=-
MTPGSNEIAGEAVTTSTRKVGAAPEAFRKPGRYGGRPRPGDGGGGRGAVPSR